MTRLSDEDLNKLEHALAEAHRSQQEPGLEAGWVHYVMRDIRREAAEHRRPLLSTWIDRLVWRTAAVVAVLVLIFAGSVLVYPSKDTVELAALLSDELDVGEPLVE